MKKANTFQVVLLAVFGVIILFSVVMFATSKSSGGKQEKLGSVTVWGTLPKPIITSALSNVYSGGGIVDIVYVQKRAETFNDELIEALASGEGPDVVMLPQDLILKYFNKIYKIPYTSMSPRVFKDRFIEEGELYIDDDGILAVPIIVDPIVMYWNRDIFSSVGISVPPKYWDEFYSLAKKITIRRNESNITRGTVAFGTFDNVKNAKQILSMLIMQAGNLIVKNDGGVIRSVIGEAGGRGIPPAVSALNFYLEFAKPSKQTYSWNSSLPNSLDMFIAGDLAVYFGFASELDDIQKKNPNLNFDVAIVPQVREGKRSLTFGNMLGVSIIKQTKNIPAAFQAIIMMSDTNFVKEIASALKLPPARRDLLAEGHQDAYLSLFYDSAIMSKAWLDPSPQRTEALFKGMIEDVLSGRRQVSGAVLTMDSALQSLISKMKL